jgi:uncharacterized membrane protein YfcA
VQELLATPSTGPVPTLALGALIVALAVVQSLFGVGLLVFGTPTLLLLGLPFDRVLMLLLPCSIVVSALQVATSGGLSLDPFRRQFLTFTTPALLLATAMTLRLGSPGGIRVLVGLMLLVTAGTRLIRPAHAAFARVVRGHLPPLLVGLGVLHGASNLGGGILSVIVGTSFELKADARRQIAFCYGIMASLQLAVVLLTGSPGIDPVHAVVLPVLAGATYLVAGQRLFLRTGQRVFDLGLTGMITAFGLVLLAT